MRYILLTFFFITSAYAQTNLDAVYLNIVEEIKDAYGPIAKSEGIKLIINWQLESKIMNATGTRDNSDWLITIYGGFFGLKGLNEESFRLILCHELGHIIGGSPVFEILPGIYTTSSGQPDYYAAASCMKLLLKDKDNSAFNERSVDKTLNQKCIQQFNNINDQNLCRRIGNAGQEFTKILNFYSPSNASFSTPSKSVVQQMEDAHPDTQCRLDTILAGALCTFIPQGLSSKEADIMNRSCAQGVSQRPRCWFKP